MQPRMLVSRPLGVFAQVSGDPELRRGSSGEEKEGNQTEVCRLSVKGERLWEHVKRQVLALRLVVIFKLK